ncbi:MAG: antitoxin [Rhodobiaceae bacterium]|jgi:hypothetical protein|nr:antitoxin [Rhodobiaceae bacterium]
MPRLSIELSDQQHQQLKVVAALNGQSIKDFVLDRAFGDPAHNGEIGEEEALHALQAFLQKRLQQVQDGKTVTRSADETKKLARQRRDGGV